MDGFLGIFFIIVFFFVVFIALKAGFFLLRQADNALVRKDKHSISIAWAIINAVVTWLAIVLIGLPGLLPAFFLWRWWYTWSRQNDKHIFTEPTATDER